MGDTEGPQAGVQTSPDHGASGGAKEEEMGTAGPVAQAGRRYWASPFAEESGQLPPTSLKAPGTPGWESLGDGDRGSTNDTHQEPCSFSPALALAQHGTDARPVLRFTQQVQPRELH